MICRRKVSLPGDCHVALLLAMTLSALHGIKIALTKKHPFGCLNIVLLKSQNFDEILTFLGKFLRGRVRVANLVFEITLS